MDYIRNHWQGNQPLFWSFWVNLVAIRLVILFVERFTPPPFGDQSLTAIAMTVVYFAVFQVVVFTWQVLGVIRACDRYQSEYGSYMTAWVAQLVVVGSVIVTLIYVLGAFQSLFTDPEGPPLNPNLRDTSQLGEYSLTLSDDKARVHLRGDFRIGITKELKALVEKHATIKGVVLSSDGGRVSEGRGVARLIKNKKLDTYILETCKSACATAFMGGRIRILGPQGKIGFHQFTMDTRVKTPYIDPQEEQKIDKALYVGQGVDNAFLERMFQASHSEIWFPGVDELVGSGVVHKVQPPR